MKIKCYRTAKFQNTDTYETDRILCQADTDERDTINADDTPMVCFVTKDGAMMCVPVQFVISIEP